MFGTQYFCTVGILISSFVIRVSGKICSTHTGSAVPGVCGKCVGTKDLERRCTDLNLELTVSADCLEYHGSWCCYDPMAERQQSCSRARRKTAQGAKLRFPNSKAPRKTKSAPPKSNCIGIDKPLILTPLLESAQIERARNLSNVDSDIFFNLRSYSGYFTVNKTDNSNTFFWFFPAEVAQPENAPLIVWLQGGPGESSLIQVFTENGPFRVDEELQLSLNPDRWSQVANMLYLDNPVGAGFSFTATPAGLSRNQGQIGRNLYEAVLQFYRMFPEFLNSELYVSGESYGGKYAPSLAYRIHLENPYAQLKLPLKGVTLGNGFVDPINQVLYGEMLHQVGTLTLAERDVFLEYERQIVQLITEERWLEANRLCEEFIAGFTPYPTYYYNVTQSNYYYNHLTSEPPADLEYFVPLMDDCDIREALHVGNQGFLDFSAQIYEALLEDIPKSVAPWFTVLMDNYRVLVYNGVLDVIVNHPGVENYLSKLPWKGRDQFNQAGKIFWKVDQNDTELAGFVREVGDFAFVAVRNSGHIVPHDQPRSALDMITRFLEKRSFAS